MIIGVNQNRGETNLVPRLHLRRGFRLIIKVIIGKVIINILFI